MKNFVWLVLVSVLILPTAVSAQTKFKALDAELTNYEYPFPVSFFPLKYKDQNLKMAYMLVKPSGAVSANGKTVVLLHGKNFSGFYWDRTIRDLTAQGYQVLVPDQIGFGKSSKPEKIQFTFQLLASTTQDLIKSLGINDYFLVGHSMGGMLATRMALLYPESVKKLILVNPIGLEDWKTVVPYKNADELYKAELATDEAKIRKYQQDVYYDGKWTPEYEKGIEVLVGWTKHKDYPKVAWNAALTAEMIITQPVFYEFKNLKMPSLLIIGTRDRTALGKAWVDPKTAASLGNYEILGKAAAKLISQSKLVELKGIGHMPQVESYNDYWKALSDFLK